jgi:hypothetical protein
VADVGTLIILLGSPALNQPQLHHSGRQIWRARLFKIRQEHPRYCFFLSYMGFRAPQQS